MNFVNIKDLIIIKENKSEILLSCQSYKLINIKWWGNLFVVDCSKSPFHQSFSDRMPLDLRVLPSVDQVKGIWKVMDESTFKVSQTSIYWIIASQS